MNKINVLQVVNQLGLGGTEKVLQTFTKYLNKQIFNVYVCSIMEGGERERILRDMGFEVYVVNYSQKALIELMESKKIDIVHIHRAGGDEPFVLMASKRANIPVVVETNVFGMVDNSQTGKSIDHYLLISKMCALRYQKWAKMDNEEFHKKGRVLYYPVDMEEFEKYKISDERIQQLRAELGIDSNGPVISRIGRPAIEKWSDLCIDMMPYIVKEVPNVKYVIMAIPETKKKEIQKRGLAKYFIFLENTADSKKITEFYYLIDVLAHSSKMGESFGLTIAEAMACQKPVVVDSTPWADNAQIELVDHGKTGFVVNSLRGYADAVVHLLRNKDEAKKMGLAGYRKVKREYEAKKITMMLEKLYIELLQKKGIKLDDEIIDRYKAIEYFPTDQDVCDFPIEYRRRMVDCFGKPSLIEVIKYKYKMVKSLFREHLGKYVGS